MEDSRSYRLHHRQHRQTHRFGHVLLIAVLLLNQQPAAASRESLSAARRRTRDRPQRLSVRVRDASNAKWSGGDKQASLSPDQTSALRQPITIALMTQHYFGSEYGRQLDNCTLEGVPLDCTYFPKGGEPYIGNLEEDAEGADATWWHAPHTCLLQSGPWGSMDREGYSPFKARADQLTVIASMESAAYYQCLHDEAFMSKFDLEMTYRRQSNVALLYWGDGYREAWEEFPLLPLSEKKDAVLYLNSNCKAPSGRNAIVSELRHQPGVTVDALGNCLNSGLRLPRGSANKFHVLRQYRYCIAMENSLAQDYVTEKVYDALAAGCLPIYYGAPNIGDFIPSVDGIIDYQALGGTPQGLAAELRRLSANDTAYLEKFQWREHPESWGEGFRGLLQQSKKPHPQCQLCQVVARYKAKLPDPETGKLREPSQRPALNISIQPPSAKRLRIKYKLADAPPP